MSTVIDIRTRLRISPSPDAPVVARVRVREIPWRGPSNPEAGPEPRPAA